MSAYLAIPEAERVRLPRGLVGRPVATRQSAYRFDIGETVSWCGDEWEIAERQRSAMGRELYQVFRPGDERPERLIDGNALRSLSLDNGKGSCRA